MSGKNIRSRSPHRYCAAALLCLNTVNFFVCPIFSLVQVNEIRALNVDLWKH